MNKLTQQLAAILLFTLPFLACAKEHNEHDRGSKKGASIQLSRATRSADLPLLAGINFDQALTIARHAVPGSVIKAELEVEDRALMYSFEIVTTTKQIKEVEIDAGNGQVLDIDSD